MHKVTLYLGDSKRGSITASSQGAAMELAIMVFDPFWNPANFSN